MRACVQRVQRASVKVDDKIVGEIGAGLLVLLGVREGDEATDARWLAEKICDLRVFADHEDKTNLSLHDVGGELLAVSQFTLYADCRKGRRPSFIAAARPEIGEQLYEIFVAAVGTRGIRVATGQFGAKMQVALVNEGPFTLLLDSQKLF
ncbi:MAG: D-aminoacyl-tRNA deacylase [Pirellulaceae bacterium]|jgi:D-tyrosyl-tRNA(Tyr) deacylase|nr:D-aminoacyl-tRNA deacylase [Pirellulaceae bacterium]